MSVLVYIESSAGKIKKSSREAVSYGSTLGDVVAVCLNEVDDAELASVGKNGAGKVLLSSTAINTSEAAASALAQAASSAAADTVVMAKSSGSGAIAARLSVKIDASMASNVVSLPDTSAGYTIRTSIFTGNAFADVELKKTNKVLTVNKNTVDIKEDGADAVVEKFSKAVGENGICKNDNFRRLIKHDYSTVACVDDLSAFKLIGRGWGI